MAAPLLAFGLALGLADAPRAQAACDPDSECSGGPARIMLIVDSHSDLLNVGMAAGGEGNTPWDVLRDVVSGPGDSLFDALVEPSGPVTSQVAHVGLAVLGEASGQTGQILIDYAPCSEPRVRWSLDPLSSCLEPGCTDPWSGPPITWTEQDGSMVDPPGFDLTTLSHMPGCDGSGNRCEGSERWVAEAIDTIHTNVGVYPIVTPYVHDDSTRYINILVVTGEYADADVDVQLALEGSFEDGIVTYVVAFADPPGGGFETQLVSMAGWGSGGTLTHRVASNPGELATVLDDIVAELALPCCATIDCSHVGGADSGGDGADGTAGDAGADWGGLDGTAGDGGTGDGGSMSGSGSGGASVSDTAGEIDDDGGCTCRSGATRPVGSLGLVLLLLGAARRRRR